MSTSDDRRPPGRRTATSDGTDAVAPVTQPAKTGRPQQSGRPLPRAEELDATAGTEHPDTQPVPPGVLDERERRQSSRRKAPGPDRQRLEEAAVVLDLEHPPPSAPPTDPA